MSFIRCDQCGWLINSDDDPAAYREKVDEWLCEVCREGQWVDEWDEMKNERKSNTELSG